MGLITGEKECDVVGLIGTTRESRRTGPGGVHRGTATSGSAAVDDPSGRRAGGRIGLCVDHRSAATISPRQAGGQLPGTDSPRALFGRASATGVHQQARQHHDAHAFGGGGADRCAVRRRVAAGLWPAGGASTSSAGQGDGRAQAGGKDVLDAAGEPAVPAAPGRSYAGPPESFCGRRLRPSA